MIHESKNQVDAGKPFFLRVLLARPQLVVSISVGVLAYFFFPRGFAHQPITRAIIGWNLGAILYLALALKMMFWSSHEKMRTRALQHDEGSAIVLTLVVTASVMCIGAIVAQLSVVKELTGTIRYAHLFLAVITIASSWAFTQVMFALHYAHQYYVTVNNGEHGGLDFPGEHPPDYGDFLYFATVIGTSTQTSDVSFTNKMMRHTGTVHCVLAFFFNTTLLALSINIASGLF